MNIIRVTFVSLIIFFILGYFFYSTFSKYFPLSEIHNNSVSERVYCSIDNFEPMKEFRSFDVLDEAQENEINEIFDYPYIEWKDQCYDPCISFFKGIDCKYYKRIPRILLEPFTFIYFPDNDIKWDSGSYFHDRKKNKYYYPEKNSVLYSENELFWVGDRDINIVLGKSV